MKRNPISRCTPMCGKEREKMVPSISEQKKRKQGNSSFSPILSLGNDPREVVCMPRGLCINMLLRCGNQEPPPKPGKVDRKKRKTGRTIERSPGERGEERQKDRGTEPRNDGSGQRGNRGREKGGRRGEEERGSQPGVTHKARGTRKGRDQPSRRGETEKKCVKQKNEKVKKEKAFSGGRERGRGCILHLAVSEPYSGAALLMRGPPADCTDRSGLEKK